MGADRAAGQGRRARDAGVSAAACRLTSTLFFFGDDWLRGWSVESLSRGEMRGGRRGEEVGVRSLASHVES